MKKIITLILAAAMIMSFGGCGKKKAASKSQVIDAAAKNTVTQPKTDEEIENMKNAEQSAQPQETTLPGNSAVQTSPTAPQHSSTAQASAAKNEEIINVSDGGYEAAVSQDSFENEPKKDGYMKYTSGDTTWGIVMPENVQIGDEDESGVLFMVDNAMLMVTMLESYVEVNSADEAKQYLNQGDVSIKEFRRIENNGQYEGCVFTYTTDSGNDGYVKYVTNGSRSAGAAAVNPDGEIGDDLKNAVDSLVIFE